MSTHFLSSFASIAKQKRRRAVRRLDSKGKGNVTFAKMIGSSPDLTRAWHDSPSNLYVCRAFWWAGATTDAGDMPHLRAVSRDRV